MNANEIDLIGKLKKLPEKARGDLLDFLGAKSSDEEDARRIFEEFLTAIRLKQPTAQGN